MKSGTLSRYLTAATLAGLTVFTSAEVVKENPYQIIIDRNPFGLKPPPLPPPPPTNAVTDTTPPPTVFLTGISTLLGKTNAFLQLKNSQTKKDEFPPPMQAGEKQGEIEVLAIDPEAGTVRIRIGDAETTLDFDKNGLKPAGMAGGPGVPPPPGNPGMVPLHVPPPPGAQNTFANPNSRVSVSGGGNPTASVAAPGAPNFGGNIPARPMRSEGNVMVAGGGQAYTPTPQPQVHANQSAEEVMRDIEARRQLMLQKEQAGQAPRGISGILPPTRYTPPTPPPSPSQ
jgi:hypothetical protein